MPSELRRSHVCSQRASRNRICVSGRIFFSMFTLPIKSVQRPTERDDRTGEYCSPFRVTIFAVLTEGETDPPANHVAGRKERPKAFAFRYLTVCPVAGELNKGVLISTRKKVNQHETELMRGNSLSRWPVTRRRASGDRPPLLRP